VPTTQVGSAAEASTALTEADVVHVHAPDCVGWDVDLVRRVARSGTPLVLTIHLPSFPPRGDWSPGRVRVSTQIAARGALLARHRARVVAPSKAAAADAAGRLGPWARVTALWNGVPDPGWSPPPAGPLRVAFVGRLDDHKKPGVFVDAVATAVRAGSDITAVVCGDGPLSTSLGAAAERSGVSDRIDFTGWVADAAQHVRNAHALVLTSEHEGCPLVAMEAAGVGRPTVARAGLEGLAEGWGEAFVSVPDDADAAVFAETLGRLAADVDGVRRLGTIARERYTTLMSADRAAASWAALYEAELARRRRS
jgi:glycosyltransferase involved in cell wall biosynthesis